MANREKIGIIGLGMIGGSLALALTPFFDIVGYDADASVRAYAEENGFCRVVFSPRDMKDCSAVFVCVPLVSMRDVLDEAYVALGDGVIITDVASVKMPFASTRGRYVGGHPMAGSERGGIKQAKPHLFQNAYYCITSEGVDADRVRAIVEKTGAIALNMSAEDHDRAVAAFSHTPHAVAYALTTAAVESCVQPIAGTGFMDSTRIAQSEGRFWSEVFKLNKDNTSRCIHSVIDELTAVAGMLERDEYAKLERYFDAARKKREALNRVDLGGETLYVDLVDRVGEFERITGAVAREGINLTNIALVPARSGASGALRLEFASVADKLNAKKAIERLYNSSANADERLKHIGDE
ncbi:MAG: prephenate dehydrogenase/arogenate dehydrogenase family protein [Roseburia sp.]|nr:prephenate dehydrogenase/arogenate dehydrogenase family protein [Roseburia sp.]